MAKGDKHVGSTDQVGNKEQETERAVTGDKLDLRKKMGTITMVTPPSFFQNQNKSFCLINLSKKDKDNFADQINKYFPKDDLTIYLWDDNNFSALDPFGNDDPEYEKYLENWKPNKKGRDYTWLLNACRAATTVILNMDYSSNQMKVWSGYILTMAKTWFLNSNTDDSAAFGVLNRNKINNMQELFPKIKKLKDSQ
mgnify:FL=1|jgi:hypothetical protein|tara:strand:+ start:407 stop:994 length:588 start_codon:yes stop_codon:yes gene_type:complete